MNSSAVNNVATTQPPIGAPHFQNLGLFKKRWVYHTIFWVAYYLFYSVVVALGIYHIYDPVFYVQVLLLFPLDIVFVYFNFYILIPRLLSPGRYLDYGLALLLAIVTTAVLNLLMKQVFAYFGSKIFAIASDFTYSNVSNALLERFYLLGLTTAIKLSKDWIQNQQRMKEKEKQYLETELNFLKSQIQPHFFFNTLNNLYSLTLKKSDQAPEVVLKLSELMSYMLYESNTQKVLLTKEIAYLQNYLDLERLRFGQRLTVSFEMEGEITEVSIPPLILILFVENSFKHGVRNILDKIAIEVLLKVEKEFLFFQVRNTVAENNGSTVTSGIGIKNVRRRLDLLYGQDYRLELEKNGNEYVVSLKIPV